MKAVGLNLGTVDNPHYLDKNIDGEYIILESGVYVLSGNVIIEEMRENSQIKEMRETLK